MLKIEKNYLENDLKVCESQLNGNNETRQILTNYSSQLSNINYSYSNLESGFIKLLKIVDNNSKVTLKTFSFFHLFLQKINFRNHLIMKTHFSSKY